MKSKEYLVEELEMVIYHSREVIETMRKIYGKESVNATELEGAADMMKTWIDSILEEIEEEK